MYSEARSCLLLSLIQLNIQPHSQSSKAKQTVCFGFEWKKLSNNQWITSKSADWSVEEVFHGWLVNRLTLSTHSWFNNHPGTTFCEEKHGKLFLCYFSTTADVWNLSEQHAAASDYPVSLHVKRLVTVAIDFEWGVIGQWFQGGTGQTGPLLHSFVKRRLTRMYYTGGFAPNCIILTSFLGVAQCFECNEAFMLTHTWWWCTRDTKVQR